MRPNNRMFCQLFSEIFSPKGPVVEIGSKQYPGDGIGSDLRPFFEDQTYVGCDMLAGQGVDRIEDISNMTFRDGEVSTMLCMETLEHVFRVEQAVKEIYRVLADSGTVLITIPFHFRIHAFPDDYWRLTPNCLNRLLAPWGGALVGYQGTQNTPHTVMAVAMKQPVTTDFAAKSRELVSQYKRWLSLESSNVSMKRRVRQWTGAFRLTKAERNQMKDEYRAEFEIRCPDRCDDESDSDQVQLVA